MSKTDAMRGKPGRMLLDRPAPPPGAELYGHEYYLLAVADFIVKDGLLHWRKTGDPVVGYQQGADNDYHFLTWRGLRHIGLHRLLWLRLAGWLAMRPADQTVEYPVIDHINGHRYDNRAENLQWLWAYRENWHAWHKHPDYVPRSQQGDPEYAGLDLDPAFYEKEAEGKWSAIQKARCNSPAYRAKHKADCNKPEFIAKQRENAIRQFQDPEFRASYDAMMASPEYREKHQAGIERIWQDPEHRAKHKKGCNSPEAKAKREALWDDPGFKANHKEAINSPDVKAKQKEGCRRRNQNPAYRARHKESMNTPEYKAKKREDSLRLHQDPVYKANHLAGCNSPKAKAKREETMNSPEYKANHKAGCNRPEVKAKHSKNGRRNWKNPAYRAGFFETTKRKRHARFRAEVAEARATGNIDEVMKVIKKWRRLARERPKARLRQQRKRRERLGT